MLVPLLPSLTTLLPGLPSAPKLDPSQERERLVAALGHLLAGWAQLKPLLFVLDSLHWTGEGTLPFWLQLTTNCKSGPPGSLLDRDSQFPRC